MRSGTTRGMAISSTSRFSALLLAIAAASAQAAPLKPLAPLGLTAAFFDCAQIGRNALALDLLHSVGDSAMRVALQAKHAAAARNYSFVRNGADIATARVELINPPRIAGLAPHALSAKGVEDGGGLAIFTLEFGQLTSRERADLAKWALSAAEGIVVDGSLPAKVQVATSPGNVSLVCDVSN